LDIETTIFLYFIRFHIQHILLHKQTLTTHFQQTTQSRRSCETRQMTFSSPKRTWPLGTSSGVRTLTAPANKMNNPKKSDARGDNYHKLQSPMLVALLK
jgi:hypothetical protein